jgi:Cdc48 subfamily AAA family protein
LDELWDAANFRSGLNPPNRPLGVLLFAGPTSVGKTEVVRQLCEFLFGNPDAMLKVDCAELQKEHYVARLMGSRHGYTGYSADPQITQERFDKHSTKRNGKNLIFKRYPGAVPIPPLKTEKMEPIPFMPYVYIDPEIRPDASKQPRN